MISKLVFLYDSRAKPWHADIEKIKGLLENIRAGGVACGNTSAK